MDHHRLTARFQPELDKELQSIVGDNVSSLYQMMRYHLGWVDADGQAKLSGSGKLLRPFLCLRACQATGGDWRQALPAAAALELLHNFTLIHDDIEDGDHERRGRPAVWRVWGLGQGVNAGDAMHVLSHLALTRLQEREVPLAKILRAMQLMDETCLQLCEGQFLDISFENRMDITEADYIQMIAGKTAALFACSLSMGAVLGTDDEEQISHLAEFGRNLGMAFQIQDDILGIWGDDAKTGKPVAGDILKRKKTLPIVRALQESDEQTREQLSAIYDQHLIGRSDILQVLIILEAGQVRPYCEGVASQYTEKALAELEATRIEPSAKEDFKSLAGFVVNREF